MQTQLIIDKANTLGRTANLPISEVERIAATIQTLADIGAVTSLTSLESQLDILIQEAHAARPMDSEEVESFLSQHNAIVAWLQNKGLRDAAQRFTKTFQCYWSTASAKEMRRLLARWQTEMEVDAILSSPAL